MATNYHVSFINPATAAVVTTVDVVSPDSVNPQVGAYLKSMQGKLGCDLGFASLGNSTTQSGSLDTLATAARRNSQLSMFITWDG